MAMLSPSWQSPRICSASDIVKVLPAAVPSSLVTAAIVNYGSSRRKNSTHTPNGFHDTRKHLDYCSRLAGHAVRVIRERIICFSGRDI